MDENRSDEQLRSVLDRMFGDMERRLEDHMDHAIPKAAEEGAAIALRKFGELTPYTLSEKHDRDELRKTILHADKLRKMCDKFFVDSTNRFFGLVGKLLVVCFILGFIVLVASALGLDVTELLHSKGI